MVGEDGWRDHDMKPQTEPSTQEALACLVERVTYHNATDILGAWTMAV
jgi:hypothetical protein